LGTQETKRIQTNNKTKNTTQFLLDTQDTRRRQTKQKHNTIYVGHLYAQKKTNKVNKTNNWR